MMIDGDQRALDFAFPLLVVTGKGGVGKTVLTAALGTEAADGGLSTLLVELGGRVELPPLLGHGEIDVGQASESGEIVELTSHLSWQTLAPDRLLAGWLAGKTMGVVVDRLERTGALGVLASSLPGIRDVLVLGHLRSLVDEGRFDRIIVDGPATGRARELFRSPHLLAEVVMEGPVADQATRANDLLTNAELAAIALVTLPEETPMSETIELAFDLEDDPGIHLGGIVVNRVLSTRGSKAPLSGLVKTQLGPRLEHELEQLDRLDAELPVEQWHLADVAGGIREVDDIALAIDLNTDSDTDRFGSGQPLDDQADSTHTDWLSDADVIVTSGTGGVGKTSVAAAVAVQQARQGKRVALITIDPARRLADAMGLSQLDDELNEVPLDRLPKGGSLSATMLDPAATFARAVERHADSTEQAAQILASPLSSQLAESLSGLTEYMAVERLWELTHLDDIDVVIVDTPPSSDAIAFLDAPALLARMLDNTIYRFLVHEQSKRNLATRALRRLVAQLVSIVGGTVIKDAVDFFVLFDGMEEHFRARAEEVEAILRSDATSFVLVTTPHGRALENAQLLERQLTNANVSVDLTVINRCTPQSVSSLDPAKGPYERYLSDSLRAEAEALAAFRQRSDGYTLLLDRLPKPIATLDGIEELAELVGGKRGGQ